MQGCELKRDFASGLLARAVQDCTGGRARPRTFVWVLVFGSCTGRVGLHGLCQPKFWKLVFRITFEPLVRFGRRSKRWEAIPMLYTLGSGNLGIDMGIIIWWKLYK